MTATVTAITKRTKPVSVGLLIDKMWDLREQKRGHDAASKAISEEIEAVESQLLQVMDSDGVVKSTGKKASAGITEAIRPNVIDWDAFYTYIGKNKYWHLLERRPSVTGCRELLEKKGKVPGVEPFTKRTINLRTV